MLSAARICTSCNSPVPPDAAFCSSCGAATPTELTGAVPDAFEERLTAALADRCAIERESGRGGMAAALPRRQGTPGVGMTRREWNMRIIAIVAALALAPLTDARAS